MKKITLLFALFTMITWVAQSQEVARNMVVVEIGTGTWTSYCVGSAMGADELLANGKSVAPLARVLFSDACRNVLIPG